MGLFDFLAPGVDNRGMARQNRLLRKGQKQLEESREEGRQDITQGADAARPAFQGAVDLFAGLGDEYRPGFDMYKNSLGLNGQGGYDAALGAFQQGPGYQFALDQANQNVLRNSAALGGVASGNTMMGLSDRAQQLQNMEFGNWQDRLAGFDLMRPYQQQATAMTNLGNMEYGKGRDMANLGVQYAPMQYQAFNDQAGLLGQQMSYRAGAEQQGFANALGIGQLLTAPFSPRGA
jgi:hypothetical protein